MVGSKALGSGVRTQGSWVWRCSQPKTLGLDLADRPRALGSGVKTQGS